MKKQIKVFSLVVLLGVITAVNVKVVLSTNRSYNLTLASIEAISKEGGLDNDEGGVSKPEFDIKKSDCVINKIVEAGGYVTLFGKKYKVASVEAGCLLRKEWINAERDCAAGGKYLCKTQTCQDLYDKIGTF